MPSAQTYAPDGASKDNAQGQKNTISDPFTLNGNVYRTETVATLKDGKVISSEVKFQKQVSGRRGNTFIDTAVTRDGGKKWVTPGSGRGSNENKPITTSNSSLTTQEIKDLQPGGKLNKTSIESAKLAVKKNGGSDAQASAAATSTPQASSPAAVESLDAGEVVDGTGKSLEDFGNFTYPLDLGKTKQDVIKFSMLEYKPSGLKFIGKSPVSERTGTGSNIIGTVVLPIPSGISDTNACVWGENTLNAATAAAAAAAFAGITKGIGAGVKEAGDSLTKALADPATKTGIAALFTANAVGTDGGAILARTAGVVINPNLELLFNGPTLRPFSFTFKMSARDKKEAEEIIKILNFFKRGMSPIKSQSNLFLKAPHTFRIQYLNRRNKDTVDHPFIGRIKECALQSINVLYTPHGEYATYTDGVMVSYEMQMQFQELEPIFNNDYDGLPGIGY